jgi:hypothetical protein
MIPTANLRYFNGTLQQFWKAEIGDSYRDKWCFEYGEWKDVPVVLSEKASVKE